MTLNTWLEIKTIIKNDLDLDDETFINDTMLLAWANNAIDEAEQHILTIYEDYFLRTENLALVTGTSEYDPPSSIYAHKIRRMFYVNGTDKYEIKRIRNMSKIPYIEDSNDYSYMITSNSSGVAKIKLFPASRETSSSNVQLWYIANATRMVDDTTVMNIPEAVPFIIAHIKAEATRTEGHPSQGVWAMERERQKNLLVDTLTVMVPDEDNELLADCSFYDEFDAR